MPDPLRPRAARVAARLLSFVALAGALSAGCAPRSGSSPESRAPLPADFRLVLGQGGGFAGRWEGFTVGADGAVQAWAGPVEAEGGRPAGRLSTEELETLWEEVRAARFFETTQRDTGNMTAFVEVTAEGRTHRVSWVPRLGEAGPESPTPMERLYASGRRAARLAQNRP